MYFVKHNVYEDSSVELRSHRNKHEAYFLVGLCRYLLQQGYDESSITVLTTYAGQFRFLSDVMKKNLEKQVRVSTVDNFQGEENDIILLSFVRSNLKNSLGFIQITNRICVALSRARKGLFCIGNFDSFAEKCGTWRKIVDKLEKMQLISNALRLRCQNHPEKITLVSSASDFDKVILGGCAKKCIFRLACRHACPLLCHPLTKSHDVMTCSKKCRDRCLKRYQKAADAFNSSSKESFVGKSMDEYFEIVTQSYCGTGTTQYQKRITESSEESSCVTISDKNDIRVADGNPDFIPVVKEKEKSCSEVCDESECDKQNIVVASISSCSESEMIVDSNSSTSTGSTQLSYVTASQVSVPLEKKANCSNERSEAASNEWLKANGGERENNVLVENEFPLKPVSAFFSETDSLVTLKDQENLLVLNLDASPDNYSSKGQCVATEDFRIQKQNFEFGVLPSEISTDYAVPPPKVANSSEAVLRNHSEKSDEVLLIASEASPSLSRSKCAISNNLTCLPKSKDIYSEGRCPEFEECGLSTYFSELVLSSRTGANRIPLESSKSSHDQEFFQNDIERQGICFDCLLRGHGKMGCDTLIPKKLQCQHEISVPCSKFNLKYHCKKQVDVQLPCLHTVTVTCCDWIWMKEIRCMYEETLLMPCGKRIKYICSEGYNHADCTAVVLKCGHKVPCYTGVDQYKCDVPIKCILPCSHQIEVPCTLHYFSQKSLCINDIPNSAASKKGQLQRLCRMKCDFLMECGHRCTGKCGFCTSNERHALCCVLIKRDLPCDHQTESECHMKDRSCTVRCVTVLSCGHQCPGECGQCYKFQIHAMCSVIVSRNLPCGHHVQWPCGSPLPICEKRCLFGCHHGRCINSCLYPCTKCARPCEWKCEHFACSARCSELCSRPPCDARCPQVLSCGHQCAGYCGEPCPNLCLFCDEISAMDKIDIQSGSSYYILLEDCQHSVLMKDLNRYFTQKSRSSCSSCPECGTVITRNRRFGNHIKSWLISNLHNYNLESLIHVREPIDRKASFEGDDIFDKLLSEMIQKHISLSFTPQVMKMGQNISILQNTIRREFLLSSCGLLDVFQSLKQWLLKHGSICSNQQVDESCRAVRRLCMLLFLKTFIGCPSREERSGTIYCEILALLESKTFGEHEEKQLIEVLDRDGLKTEGKASYIRYLLRFIQDLNDTQNSSSYQVIDFSRYFGIESFRIFSF